MESNSLMSMLTAGLATIPVSRSEDIFTELEGRALSEAEERIIAQRVALQQSLLATYEKRERQRKAQAISEIFPDLATEDISLLLDLFRSEEEAVSALTADPDLLSAHRKDCGRGFIEDSRSTSAGSRDRIRIIRVESSSRAQGHHHCSASLSVSKEFEPDLPELPKCNSRGKRSRRSRPPSVPASPKEAGVQLQVSQPMVQMHLDRRDAASAASGSCSIAAAVTITPYQGYQADVAASPSMGIAEPARHSQLQRLSSAAVADSTMGCSGCQNTEPLTCLDQEGGESRAADAQTQQAAHHNTSPSQPCSKGMAALLGVHPEADIGEWPSPCRGGRPQRRAAQGVARLLRAIQQPPERLFSALLPRTPAKRQKVAAVKSKGEPAEEGQLEGDILSHLPSRKPRLGRVKKCSTKAVELLSLGQLCHNPGWHNKGYIFPDGYVARTAFQSSRDLGQACWHTCSILGKGGKFWPGPTFQIVAEDDTKPIVAKSATGAWTGILHRINAAIEARQRAGDDLQVPGTAIPGPEFFGLCNPSIMAQIERLDSRHVTAYWQGKQERLAYARVHGTNPERKGPATPSAHSVPKRSVHRSSVAQEPSSDTDMDEDDIVYADDSDEDSPLQPATNRWSAVDRAERMMRRRAEEGQEEAAGVGGPDEDNPLAGTVDPITLQALRSPAISPAGHVLGMATWAAVLAEHGRCPFTMQPLHRGQLVLLTRSNIERYRSRLVATCGTS